MLDRVDEPAHGARGFCNVCAHDWPIDDRPPRGHQPAAASRQSPPVGRASEAARREPEASTRFRSVEHLVRVAGLHKDEVAVLASIGALNSLGHDRRSALWQVERVVRPSGELFREDEEPPVGHLRAERASVAGESVEAATSPTSPLRPMTPLERLVADYSGTGLSVGPHPMALKRAELALRGVLRATDLPHARAGRRVRVAGAVITRQRPGTAKGFVFLTLEDETGISNVIVRPDVFTAQRGVIVHESFVLVEGVLQQQDGVASVRAERVEALGGRGPSVESHDFR